MIDIYLTRDQYFEFEKIAIGAFLPLRGFMTERECLSVINALRLPNGEVFSIPILLDIDAQLKEQLKVGSSARLVYKDTEVGELEVESLYALNKEQYAKEVFGTNDKNHPGVTFLYKMKDFFVGGPIKLKQRIINEEIGQFELTPEETKAYFSNSNWKTIAAFQTRNIPHKAHEYLQRIALEIVDGLLIHPLIGKKKPGDYTPWAIQKSYETLISQFYPDKRVLLSFLTTRMHYAGPREAVFHAIVRRNYGCTHFIVGRDHAGVGNYYGKYAAQSFAMGLEDDIGIKILPLSGPYYCKYCDCIVTERSCSHDKKLTEEETDISGTQIRKMLLKNELPNYKIIRPEILNCLSETPTLFIPEEVENAY